MTRFCPDKFEPKAKDIEWAMTEFKVTKSEVLRQLVLMRDHEFRRPYTDWHRVFRNWLRKCEEIETFKRERIRRVVAVLSEEERKTDAQAAWATMHKYGAKK